MRRLRSARHRREWKSLRLRLHGWKRGGRRVRKCTRGRRGAWKRLGLSRRRIGLLLVSPALGANGIPPAPADESAESAPAYDTDTEAPAPVAESTKSCPAQTCCP